MLELADTSMDHVTGLPAGMKAKPVFTDGFGSRYLTFDPEAGDATDPIEILAFERALVDSSDFAAALGTRVARLAGVRHTFYARVRRLDRPTSDSLLLVSDRVAGWRLAQVLEVTERNKLAFDISAVLSLLRQLIPAVSLFARHQKDLAVGAIGPERLILTPQGRLVVAEYVLGPAIEKLAYSRDRLWRTLRVATPAGGVAHVSPRSDVLEIGVVVLSLLLGRLLREDEFPGAVGDLLHLANESSGGTVKPLSAALTTWLGRALQVDSRTAFQSPHEAQVGFEEMLASERGYVTTAAPLDAFIARFAAIAGPLPEPVKATVDAPLPVTVAEPEPEPAPEPPKMAEELPPPVVEPPPVVDEPPAVVAPPPEPQKPARPPSGIFRKTAPPPALELRGEHPEPPLPPAVAGPPAYAAPPSSAYTAPSYTAPEPYAEPEPSYAEPEPSYAESEAASAAYEPAEPITAVSPDVAPAPVVAEPAEAVAKAEPAAVRVRVGDETRKWTTGALAGFALLVVLEAVVIIWLWNRGSADTLSGEGELVVQSRPPGAVVTIDRQERGVTPLTIRLSPGTHVLELRVGAGEPRVIPLQIRAGVQTAQYVELQTPADNPVESPPKTPGKGRR